MIFSNTFCQLFGINNPKWKIWVQKLFITYWKICYKRLFITYFPICYKRFILHDRLFIRYWKILYKRSEKIVKYLISWLGAEPYFLFWIAQCMPADISQRAHQIISVLMNHDAVNKPLLFMDKVLTFLH